MMWNWMVSALASNVSLVVFDGAALTPKFSIWDLIDEYNINVFGCSASFIGASEKRKIDINKKFSSESVRLILSTGSPLYQIIMIISIQISVIRFNSAQFLVVQTLFLVLRFATH